MSIFDAPVPGIDVWAPRPRERTVGSGLGGKAGPRRGDRGSEEAECEGECERLVGLWVCDLEGLVGLALGREERDLDLWWRGRSRLVCLFRERDRDRDEDVEGERLRDL